MKSLSGGGRYAEYWDLDEARWIPAIAPADVRSGAPTLLVRTLDASVCAAFGHHVVLLDIGAASTKKERSKAMKVADRVGDESAARLRLLHEVWVVIWLEVCFT